MWKINREIPFEWIKPALGICTLYNWQETLKHSQSCVERRNNAASWVLYRIKVCEVCRKRKLQIGRLVNNFAATTEVGICLKFFRGFWHNNGEVPMCIAVLGTEPRLCSLWYSMNWFSHWNWRNAISGYLIRLKVLPTIWL